MNVKVVTGDAAIGAWLDRAAGLIEQEFSRPAMQTTPNLLRWHLTGVEFDGARPIAVVATSGERLVGFAGATPRPVSWSGVSGTIYVVSFVCVAGSQQGQGLGAALYDRLLGAIPDQYGRVLTFAHEGSLGMRLLERAYRSHGFAGGSLGALPARAILRGRLRGGGAAPVMSQEPVLGLEQRPALVRHLDADPRGSVRLGPVGARAIAAWRRTADALEPLLLLEGLPTGLGAAALAEAITEAFDAYPSHGKLAVVPNCSTLDPAVATAVGLRQMAGPTYRAWFWSRRRDDPFLAAAVTSHPVL